MKKQILAIALLSASAVYAQEFPENLPLACKAGKRFFDVEIGSQLSDGKGGTLRKKGMVGLRWGSGAQPVWAKAEKAADGSFTVAFPGRKPMTIKQTRTPTDEYDYAPFISIKEDGGKNFLCGYAGG